MGNDLIKKIADQEMDLIYDAFIVCGYFKCYINNHPNEFEIHVNLETGDKKYFHNDIHLFTLSFNLEYGYRIEFTQNGFYNQYKKEGLQRQKKITTIRNFIYTDEQLKKLKHQRYIDYLAIDTINGKYGNGQTRKDLLGDNYSEVQKRVNELMNIKENSSFINILNRLFKKRR